MKAKTRAEAPAARDIYARWPTLVAPSNQQSAPKIEIGPQAELRGGEKKILQDYFSA